MNKQTLITLLLSIFIALLGIGIIIPVMPVFATELGASGFSLGMIIAAFSISRGLLQPVVGSLSDSWGRKRFLVSGLIIYGIVGLLIPQAGSVLHLIVIRAFHGVGSAMIVPIAMAYMSFLAPPDHEGRYMSYLNIAIFCGIGCGPMIGGVASDLFGFASVFYIMAVLSFGASGLVIHYMPVQPSGVGKNQNSLLGNMSLMLKSRKTMGILIARYATMIVMVPTMAFLPLLMTQRFAASGLQIGLVIALRTLANAALQVPFGKIADRFNKVILLIGGCICLSSAIMCIPMADSFMMILTIYGILGLGEAIIWPVLGAYASKEGKEHYGHGTMMGVFSLAMSAGVFTGATLAGIAMDSWGIDFAFYVTSLTVLCISLAAAMMIGSSESRLIKRGIS